MVNEQKNDTRSAARHDTIRKKNINLSTDGMHVVMLTVLFTRLLCLLLQAIHRSAEGPRHMQWRGDRLRQGGNPECSQGEDWKLLGGIEQGWPVAKHSARQGKKPECSQGDGLRQEQLHRDGTPTTCCLSGAPR